MFSPPPQEALDFLPTFREGRRIPPAERIKIADVFEDHLAEGRSSDHQHRHTYCPQHSFHRFSPSSLLAARIVHNR